jgi:hypothetical protein
MTNRSLPFPVDQLLDEACSRLRRQVHFARPLASGGNKAAEIDNWLKKAEICISQLARPIAVFRSVAADARDDEVSIEGKLLLTAPTMAADIRGGGKLSVYALTLNYAQEDAFAWADRDYMVHHVQTDLGRQVLFALGRAAQRRVKSEFPDQRLRRFSVRHEDSGNAAPLWDAARAQALLQVFGDSNPGISLTDTGFFRPLNSLVGLMTTR